MSKKPEALVLADLYQKEYWPGDFTLSEWARRAVVELRRLQTENSSLRKEITQQFSSFDIDQMMKLADDYALKCFNQGLYQNIDDDKPGKSRKLLFNAMSKLFETIGKI